MKETWTPEPLFLLTASGLLEVGVVGESLSSFWVSLSLAKGESEESH